MFKIYTKSEEEIKKQTAENQIYANMVNGTAKPVCRYYVLGKEKKHIDISTFSENQVITTCKNSIEYQIKGESTKNNVCSISDACLIVQEFCKSNNFSGEGLNEIFDLFESDDKKVASVSKDIFMKSVESEYVKVSAIANYLLDQKDIAEKDRPKVRRQLIKEVIDNQAKKSKQKTAETRVTMGKSTSFDNEETGVMMNPDSSSSTMEETGVTLQKSTSSTTSTRNATKRLEDFSMSAPSQKSTSSESTNNF